jgi:hypothetical protein
MKNLFRGVYPEAWFMGAIIVVCVGFFVAAFFLMADFEQDCKDSGGTVQSYYDPIDGTTEVWCE